MEYFFFFFSPCTIFSPPRIERRDIKNRRKQKVYGIVIVRVRRVPLIRSGHVPRRANNNRRRYYYYYYYFCYYYNNAACAAVKKMCGRKKKF